MFELKGNLIEKLSFDRVGMFENKRWLHKGNYVGLYKIVYNKKNNSIKEVMFD